MNSITEFLNLEDEDIIISDIRIENTTKFLTLETKPSPHFCPLCNYRMHSRGTKKRTINHPILQDGYQLTLLLKQRRWRCTNPVCCYESNESFHFINRYRRNTNASDFLIVNAFRDLTVSAVNIAKRFQVSDTHVLNVFDRYVKLDRLPLTDIISVDEVHLDIDPDCKYGLVIQDFYSGDPIDMLPSRRSKVTEPYFVSIPKEERNAVKYLISDMYNPYIQYVDKYFPNAVSVVDSFHVIQWVIREIDNFLRSLLKNYRKRDKDYADKLSCARGYEVRIPESNEVYLLRKYKWIVLTNQKNIYYHSEPRMDHHFRQLMNTYDYERALLNIHPRIAYLRDLKEAYITFNTRNAGKPMDARIELDVLIKKYLGSEDDIFQHFAELLIKYHDPIINSFIMVQKHGSKSIYYSRLSNGPIESLNRKVKDLKRSGRGYSNFEHFRNRFLYATRNNPVINVSSEHNSIMYYEDDEQL